MQKWLCIYCATCSRHLTLSVQLSNPDQCAMILPAGADDQTYVLRTLLAVINIGRQRHL